MGQGSLIIVQYRVLETGTQNVLHCCITLHYAIIKLYLYKTGKPLWKAY